MLKKMLMFMTCALLAATGALYSVPSQAATGYYFVSVCVSASPVDCPAGSNPAWFGPYASWAQCNAAWAIWSTGPFGSWPRSLSSCFSY